MEGCAARASIPASSPCTWPSTITRAWPSPRCSPIRRPKPPSPSCTRLSTSLPTTASAFALCLPTTAQATAPTCSAQLAKICSSNTAVPSPTPPERTAKRNASSKPRCASGPMQNTGQTQSKETPTCSHGPTTTTTSGHMVASATSRPSADPKLVQRLDHLQAPCHKTLQPHARHRVYNQAFATSSSLVRWTRHGTNLDGIASGVKGQLRSAQDTHGQGGGRFSQGDD